MTTTKIETSQCDQGTSFEFTNYSLVSIQGLHVWQWPIPMFKNVFSNSITHVTLNFRKVLISYLFNIQVCTIMNEIEPALD
jgi:hypothetical protein